MSARMLAYLDADGIATYRWRRGHLVADGHFAAGDDGLERFDGHLKAAGQCVCHLLVNVADEEYRVETIPYLKGRDRQAILARKNAQFFPATPFAAAFSLGVEKNGRKNERVLLHALGEPSLLEPWLHSLVRAGIALAGVYSAAQLGALLLAQIGKPAGAGLLLMQVGESIREICVLAKQPLFSRLVALPAGDGALAPTFAAEALKLRHYLLGQRHVERDQILPAWVLAHPQSVETCRERCAGIPGLACTVMDNHAVAARIGLLDPPQDNRCETLLLHLLGRDLPRQQFAPEALRHDYLLQRARRVLLGSGVAAFLAALPFAALPLYQSRALLGEAARLAAGEGDLERRYAAARAGLASLPADPATLTRIATRHAELIELPEPAAAYRFISQALSAAPGAELDAIDWKEVAPGGEEIVLHGYYTLAGERQPRQIVQEFDGFVRSLQDSPATRVEVLQAPIDLSSGGSGTPEEATRKSFALRITRPARR